MSKFNITVDEVRVYEADSEALKDQFPVEYEEWVADCEDRGEEPTDKGWVATCLAEAGTDQFEQVSHSYEQNIHEQRRARA